MRRWLALLMLLAAPALHAQTVQAVTEDSAYSYLAQGRVAGPATEVVRAALARAGFEEARIDLYPWARAYEMALSQPNVLIFLIARTPEREHRFKWVAELMKMQYHLYKRASRTDIQVASLEAARRYSIGVIRDDVRQQYLKRKGFEHLVESAGNDENFRQLLAGRVDLVALAQSDATLLCAKYHVDCSTVTRVLTLDELTVGLYMAFSKATDDPVAARLGRAYQALKAEGALAPLE